MGEQLLCFAEYFRGKQQVELVERLAELAHENKKMEPRSMSRQLAHLLVWFCLFSKLFKSFHCPPLEKEEDKKESCY